MKERPILLNTDMVRAVLENRKTQTRRVVNSRTYSDFHSEFSYTGCLYNGATPDTGLTDEHQFDARRCFEQIRCPYGKPGDLLWVRETWRLGAWSEDQVVAIDYRAGNCARKEWLKVEDPEEFERLWIQSTDECASIFGQQDNYTWPVGESPLRWRPSIHMPRWASRLVLEITDVHVERVQDISNEDAFAEGVQIPVTEEGGLCIDLTSKHRPTQYMENQVYKGNEVPFTNEYMTMRPHFAALWDSVATKPSFRWEHNPWVWVVKFKLLNDLSEQRATCSAD